MTNPFGSVATSDGRYYERDGEKFLSVTNIIDKAMSKPALVPWAVKLCAEAALADLHRCRTDADFKKLVFKYKDTTTSPKINPASEWKRTHTKVKDAAAERGTTFHNWAEGYILGQEPDPPDGLAEECVGFIRCVEKNGIEAIAAEATVYSREFSYAGTGDLWATVAAWGGIPVMIDYKTSKSTWPETALQLAAYRRGEFIGLPDGSEAPVPETQAGAVMHVDHGETHLIPYRSGAAEFEVFKACRIVAGWVVEESQTVKNHPGILSA